MTNDYHSEDITFCMNKKCKNKKCYRHSINIHQVWLDHSFAEFTDCEYWENKNEK